RRRRASTLRPTKQRPPEGGSSKARRESSGPKEEGRGEAREVETSPRGTMAPTASSLALLALAPPSSLPIPSLAFATLPLPRPRSPLPPLHLEASTASASTAKGASESACSEDAPPSSILARVDRLIASFASPSASNFLDPTEISSAAERDHEADVRWAQSSPLPFEGSGGGGDARQNGIEYERVSATDGTTDEPIAVRTKSSTPLLDESELRSLRRAAESYWARPIDCGGEAASAKSRFTYQREGNSEAHLSDVVNHARKSDPNSGIGSLVDELLSERIYPWIREAYLSREEGGDALELYVYDALFVRYDATKLDGKGKGGSGGAGQPLHRDLGYVSSNVMLNSDEEFEGGGTLFEDRLLPALTTGRHAADSDPNDVGPLKPLGPGHALAHPSSARHAGAATTGGTRDILVFFLAARATPSSPRRVPRWERGARLKSTARSRCSGRSNACEQSMCRALHHRLAVDQVPDDGEAWHYLGRALFEHHQALQIGALSEEASDRRDGGLALELAVACLDEAAKRTPCDARLFNNLGIALESLLERRNSHSASSETLAGIHRRIVSAYRKSLSIHSLCDRLGCDVAADREGASLNYGLYLSKLDDFEGAVDVLSEVAPGTFDPMDARAQQRLRVIGDATSLLSFCKKQIEKRRAAPE
ncbi:hypothetical protein ACHAWF_002863, partial [Thalassiosira exigua]